MEIEKLPDNLIAYKCRAEIATDAYSFALNNSKHIWVFKVKRMEKGIPDVVVTFKSELSLEKLKEKMSKIEDAHVMYESLNLKEEYNGERIALKVEIQKEYSKDIQLAFLQNTIEIVEKGNYTRDDVFGFKKNFFELFPNDYVDLFRVFNRLFGSKNEYLPKAKKYMDFLKRYSYEETMNKIYL